jgi:RND family efflux transporter MFP subunit
MKPIATIITGTALFSCIAASFLASTALARDDAIPVTVTRVAASEVAPRVPAAGTVFSRNETQVTAGIAGRLEWVAEPGLFVAAGEAVARFDCDMLELRRERQVAEAERAKINFARLGREVERLESLEEQSVIAEIELDRTRAERDLAGSDMTIARITVRETDSELGRCAVRAPFSGVVTERLQRAGEDVERSTVIARMTDTQNLEVRVSVPIRHLPRMRVGSVASVKMNELELAGRIRSIVPAANSQSQTFEVRLELPDDAPTVVAAGQLVSVTLPLSATSALTVPRDSVVLTEDGTFVMRITEKATAERVAVQVTESSGDRIAVRGPLESGDTIAVRGAESLEGGESVIVRTET